MGLSSMSLKFRDMSTVTTHLKQHLPDDQRMLRSYLYIVPISLVYVLFMLYPIIQSFLMSFRKRITLMGQTKWVGFDNYVAVLTDPLFWHSLKNTIIFSIGMVLIPLILGLGLAIALNAKIPGMRVFRTIIFSPQVVPIVVAGVLFSWIFNIDGILNSFLLFIGIIEERIAWLGSPSLALPSVMVMAVWRRTGYYMVILLAGLQGIPSEVYEAAKIHGKSRWKTFRHITLPLLRPALLITVALGVIDSIKLFSHVYAMTGGGPAHASEILSTYFYTISFKYYQFGKGAATAFILFVIALALALVVIRVGGGENE